MGGMAPRPMCAASPLGLPAAPLLGGMAPPGGAQQMGGMAQAGGLPGRAPAVEMQLMGGLQPKPAQLISASASALDGLDAEAFRNFAKKR